MRDDYKITDPADMVPERDGGVVHPCPTIRQALADRDLTAAEAAQQLGINEERITAVLDGHARLDPGMAEMLGGLLGPNSPDFFYNWQLRHDESQRGAEPAEDEDD